MAKTKKVVKKRRMIDGLPIIDATESLDLCVNKEDISRSRSKNPAECAAAKAISRQLHTEVRVHVSRTYVKKGKHWERYNTPQSVAREIISFDRGASFTPGDYTLSPVSESNRLGTYRGKSSKGNGKKRRKPRIVTAGIRPSARE